MYRYNQLIYFLGYVVLPVGVGMMIIIWVLKGLNFFIPEKILNTIIRIIFGVITLSGLIGFIYYLWRAIN